MAVAESIVLGVSAGLSLSPHNLGLVLGAARNSKVASVRYIAGALVFDLLALPFIVWIALRVEIQESFYAVLSAIASTLFIYFFIKSLNAQNTASQNGQNLSIEVGFKNGIIVQALNPFPYVFWASVGLLHVSESLSFAPIFLTTVYFSKVILYSLARFCFFCGNMNYLLPLRTLARCSYICFAAYYACLSFGLF